MVNGFLQFWQVLVSVVIIFYSNVLENIRIEVLRHFAIVALLAVYDFWSFGGVACLKFIGAVGGAVEMGGLVGINAVV